MIEDLKIIIDNHGLFLVLFFSGVLFGVVAQKMIDNQSNHSTFLTDFNIISNGLFISIVF